MKKSRFIAAFLLVFAAVSLNAIAIDIISAVPVKTEKGKKADFVFSGSATVRNVAFEKGAVLMPVTVYKDKTYKDIKLLSKSVYAKIEACFLKDKCAAAIPAAMPKLTVSEVRPLKSPIRVANVTVAFDGDLSVTFGLIKKNSGETFAAYPDNFDVKDEALKSLINKTVEEGFKKSLKTGTK